MRKSQLLTLIASRLVAAACTLAKFCNGSPMMRDGSSALLLALPLALGGDAPWASRRSVPSPAVPKIAASRAAACPVKNTAELVAAAKNTACAEIELAVGRYVLEKTCGDDLNPIGLCLARDVTLVGQPGVVLDGGGKVRVLYVGPPPPSSQERELAETIKELEAEIKTYK